MPDLPTDLASTTRRARTLLLWYRRPLAAALLVLAALTALGSSGDAARGRQVVVAARDLPAGVALDASAVRTARVPADVAPVVALTDTASAVGRVPALPVHAGEPLTDARFADRALLAELAATGDGDLVAVPVPLADGATGTLVRPGDVVDVLGSGELGSGGTVVSGATVLLSPVADGDAAATGTAAVVLAVRRADAASIARASATSRLSLALRPLPPP